MTSSLDLAYHASKDWLAGLDQRPVGTSLTYAQLAERFAGALPEQGLPPQQVIAELVAQASDGLLGNASGRFFAWVIGGALDSTLAADWLVASWDQNAAVYACSPAAAVLEEKAGQWLKELLDLPREASFAFTTGCQMAHATALAAARFTVLKQHGWDVEEDGLFNAPAITILTSEHKHGSVERAARLLGFGRKAIIGLDTNAAGQITPSTLEMALGWMSGPVIVVLNAGDLNIGACDPFAELIPIAQRAGAWVHVDGAFGLFARCSPVHQHLLAGVEAADSWATDAHKWLNVPFDCGIAIVRDPAAHRAAMTMSTAYVANSAQARDQLDWNPEWSRRARGIPVYAALKELGRQGMAELVERCCRLCLALVEGIGALPGVTIVALPVLNQGLVRFERSGASATENDDYTDAMIQRINDTGEAFFSGSSWQSRRVMRVSVVNWRSTDAHVSRAIAAVAGCGSWAQE